jgi:hypothetical protein
MLEATFEDFAISSVLRGYLTEKRRRTAMLY